ncbi:hypothetical protein [Clostridium algidicarnis]|uniref:hypothetical protein n=1 Tax=Clostridium algidicarnis TaxID=37659 RepID=UPI001C0DC5DD|nr:hypothetical protein [Clostridium algidicarnis]MBU3204381.1 hypothetical protein [Clostridium algidicarnis]MBU3212535.1 hypothetical protein [Clostridium algidicarnis]MBU3222966.1 hypothetical protein [Clostridium algidicarnis]
MINKLNKKTLLFLCLIIFSLSVACSNKNITEEFSNTTWESSDKLLALKFTSDSLSIDINVKPNINETDIEKGKKYEELYDMGTHKNVKVEKNDNNIKIFNKDGLNLEFEIISESEIKDKDNNVFKKK